MNPIKNKKDLETTIDEIKKDLQKLKVLQTSFYGVVQ